MLLHSGGPDGEIAASMRYLSQRFAMPNRIAMGTLNDIGTSFLLLPPYLPIVLRQVKYAT